MCRIQKEGKGHMKLMLVWDCDRDQTENARETIIVSWLF